jgi:hypothetical protein
MDLAVYFFAVLSVIGLLGIAITLIYDKWHKVKHQNN